jgi:TolB protein
MRGATNSDASLWMTFVFIQRGGELWTGVLFVSPVSFSPRAKMANGARRILAVAGFVMVLAGGIAVARDKSPTGLFAGSADVGAALRGSTVFDPAHSLYTLTGGGADMWGAADAFHFAWKRVEGDATLIANVHFPPGPHPPNEKAVLIFRQSLDPDAPYADVAVHADGHITLQWRDVRGGATDDTVAPEHGAATLRIERHDDSYVAYASDADGHLDKFASVVVALHDPVYVGLGVCAHDAGGVATVTFTNVTLKQ